MFLITLVASNILSKPKEKTKQLRLIYTYLINMVFFSFGDQHLYSYPCALHEKTVLDISSFLQICNQKRLENCGCTNR